MSGFLIDTNVISLFAPARAKASEHIAGWMSEQETADALYLSAVTVHEIEKGARLLETKGATARAEAIRFWLLGLISTYSDRILAMDSDVAMIAGELEAKAISSGHNPGMADAIIAGTAKAHGLSVVTWNVKDFVPFGVEAISPDEAVR